MMLWFYDSLGSDEVDLLVLCWFSSGQVSLAEQGCKEGMARVYLCKGHQSGHRLLRRIFSFTLLCNGICTETCWEITNFSLWS